MNNSDFIETIAAYIKKYAPMYGIEVVSPIIAQAVLESGYGTSELAVNAHNYFGMKYREGRCKTCIGVYHMVGSEQNADRVNRLKQAGYDPSEVQSEVNKLF